VSGAAYLDTVATFDEVSAGQNWLNSEAVQFLWRDHLGEPATPQLVLVERDVEVDKTKIRIGADKIALRLVGAGEIAKWLEDGS
jgi:hypothetical protein